MYCTLDKHKKIVWTQLR